MDRPLWLYLGLIGVIAAFGLPLCLRGINVSDEGYMLQQSLDLLGGRVIYRDMDSFVAPGMWFLIAAVFKSFGPSVFASRMLMLAAYVGLGLTGYRIVTPLAGRAYGLATVASLLLFSVWAFPTWTFAFYSPVAILLCLAALERLLAWQRSQKNRDLLLTGALLGLAICFKQNYGVFASMGAILGYAAMRLERASSPSEALRGSPREVALVAVAMVGVGLPFLFYFLAHGALEQAWLSLVVHPFEFAGRHDIPYAAFSDLWKPGLYNTAETRLTYLSYAKLNTPPILFFQPNRLAERLHVLLYWIAPLVLTTGLVCAALRGRRKGQVVDSPLFTCIAVGGFTFLGVLPRADFNHLVNVYQPIVVAAPLVVWAVLDLIGRQRVIARALVIALTMTMAAVYGGVAIYWYASLLERMDTRLDLKRGGVLVDALQALRIEQQVRTIQRRSNEGDAVLTVPDMTMLNFLSDRRVPSKWYNLYEHHIAADRGRGVVEGSEENSVNLILTRYDNFFSDRVGLLDYAPDLSNYIVSHFKREFIGDDENFIVYLRRAEPELEEPYVNALMDCEAEDRMSQVKDHLLFSTVAHKSHPLKAIPRAGLKTRCWIEVPDQSAILSLEVGYRKPYSVTPGTMIGFDISVVDETGRAELLKERMRVVQRRNAVRQQPFKRFDLDLGPWTGQEVVLEFETQLDGTVRNHPADLRGFAGIYRDVRVQRHAGGARP
ncbi:MAG: glycosyltransferase family 39 protein [Myxococcota bacterium]